MRNSSDFTWKCEGSVDGDGRGMCMYANTILPPIPLVPPSQRKLAIQRSPGPSFRFFLSIQLNHSNVRHAVPPTSSHDFCLLGRKGFFSFHQRGSGRKVGFQASFLRTSPALWIYGTRRVRANALMHKVYVECEYCRLPPCFHPG